MEFKIVRTDEAERTLKYFSARERRIIAKGIADRLVSEPTKLTRALKKLRANPFADYQLSIEDFRVLYNVDVEGGVVKLLLVGKKQGNELIVEGKAFHAHESDSSEGPAS